MALTGAHERTLDDKSRLALPPSFRAQFGNGVFLSCPPGAQYLVLVDPPEMERQSERLRGLVRIGEMSQDHERLFLASIVEAKPDAQGRVLVPQELRTEAGLSNAVVLIGVQNRAELWSAEAWATLRRQTTGLADELAKAGFWL